MNAVATQVPMSTSDWKRNFVWLVRRELWEHRGRFLITPLVLAAIIVVTSLYGFVRMDANNIHIQSPGFSMNVETAQAISAQTHGMNYVLYLAFSIPFLAVMFFVTAYYAMDTLYADRRDRSFLFWKSLPISDVETVLSKLTVAAIIAPAIAFGISIVTTLIVMTEFTGTLAAHGGPGARFWTLIPVFQNIVLVLYALVVIALWYLPIWAWLLFASAWAQRAVFLWATVPIAGAWFLEYQTFGTHHVAELVRDRFFGMAPLALHVSSRDLSDAGKEITGSAVSLFDLTTPGDYFSSPQLWIGIAVAAALVAATVWMRRYREAA